MNNSISQNIKDKISKGEEISPFLFLSNNIEILDSDIQSLALGLLESSQIPKTQLFSIMDNGESIKIKDMKIFLERAHRKPSFQFQIFLIENISRMTLKASNAALKFLEEPGLGNIVFLTNISEAGVLDTILSRVQSIQIGSGNTQVFRENYYNLIDSYFATKDMGILSYFFSQKLEKQDYVDFLKTLLYYTKNNPSAISHQMLTELEQDINLIQRNNLLPKYIVDKYLLSL